MSFKQGANGIEKKGKTKGRNLGDDGPTMGIEGGKGKHGAKSVTSEAMKKFGRNLAKAKNQGY